MKKMYFLTLAIIFIITVGFVYFSNDEEIYARKFLTSYGIKTERRVVSRENIIIPEEFDDVYKNYNELQQASGLDLSAYRGKAGIRLSYKVLNFPEEIAGEVFANVILIDGIPIAGDIMSPKIDGFMVPLSFIANYEKGEAF